MGVVECSSSEEVEPVADGGAGGDTLHYERLGGAGKVLGTSKADPRRQQDWFLKCLQGGRAHPLAACAVEDALPASRIVQEKTRHLYNNTERPHSEMATALCSRLATRVFRAHMPRPARAFRAHPSAAAAARIELVPCLTDNYSFLLYDEESGLTAAVDPAGTARHSISRQLTAAHSDGGDARLFTVGHIL